MIAVVRNGVCEIHNHLGHRLVTLPPVNIDEAVLQGKYVAVVLRNGYCQLYLTSGDPGATRSREELKGSTRHRFTKSLPAKHISSAFFLASKA